MPLPLSVQPLQGQGNISGVATSPTSAPLTMAQPQAQPTISTQQPPAPAPLSVAPAPTQEISSIGTIDKQTPYTPPISDDLKSQITNVIQQNRGKYSDSQILSGLIADNKDTHPEVAQQLQSFMGSPQNTKIDPHSSLALYNNPMGLKDPATGKFQSFSDPQAGFQAGLADLQGKASGNSRTGTSAQSTLLDLSKAWAGTGSNNVTAWANSVANDLGVPVTTPIGQIDPTKLAAAVAKHETGYTMSGGYDPKTILDGLVSDNPIKTSSSAQDTGLPTVSQELLPGLQLNKLGGKLSQRGTDITNSINDPNAKWYDKALQVTGNLAGGLGDVVNTGLEAIPGVKLAEDELGLGVGALAKTSAGQSVISSLQSFAQAHPELAKNSEATFNIVTAIPILKGLGVAGSAVMDAASMALKSIAEKTAISDLSEVAGRTIAGRSAMETVPAGFKTLVDKGALPDFVTEGGVTRYSTENANNVINNAISSVDKNELQPVLDEVSKNQNFGQQLATLKKAAYDAAENDTNLKESGMVPQALKRIDQRFEGWQHSYGDSVDLSTENRLKIGSGKFVEWGTPEGSADKAIYRALQGNIEDVARANGLDTVNAANQKMGNLIKSKDLLDAIDGKVVKAKGILKSSIAKDAATGAGAMLSGGNPIAGAAIGRSAEGLLGKLNMRDISYGMLKRTSPGSTPFSNLGSLPKLFAGKLQQRVKSP